MHQNLLPGLASSAIASGRELTGGGERDIARVGLVEPACAGRDRRRQASSLAPRLADIIAQSAADPGDDGAAIVAGPHRCARCDQFCRTRLQPIDQACAGGGFSAPAATVFAPT